MVVDYVCFIELVFENVDWVSCDEVFVQVIGLMIVVKYEFLVIVVVSVLFNDLGVFVFVVFLLKLDGGWGEVEMMNGGVFFIGLDVLLRIRC